MRCVVSMTYAVLFAWIVVAAAGCGSAPAPTFPVEGTVTLNGQPVQSGTVLFHSVEKTANGQGYTARGNIDHGGHYRLTTFSPNDGAVAGQHRVAVLASMAQVPESTMSGKPQASPIPPIYSSPSTSGLQFEVTDCTNQIDLQLNTAK